MLAAGQHWRILGFYASQMTVGSRQQYVPCSLAGSSGVFWGKGRVRAKLGRGRVGKRTVQALDGVGWLQRLLPGAISLLAPSRCFKTYMGLLRSVLVQSLAQNQVNPLGCWGPTWVRGTNVPSPQGHLQLLPWPCGIWSHFSAAVPRDGNPRYDWVAKSVQWHSLPLGISTIEHSWTYF